MRFSKFRARDIYIYIYVYIYIYAHLSLVVIFTIKEAGDAAGMKERTVPNGDFLHWEKVRGDDRVRTFIMIFTHGEAGGVGPRGWREESPMVILTIGEAGRQN